MSVASELTALNGYILGAYDEVNTKGGTVPQNKNMANLATAIGTIPEGSSTTITPLSVTSNGTYTAPTGTAYSPVTVNVSGGIGIPREINQYGILVAPQTFVMPPSVTEIGPYAMYYAGARSSNITSADMSHITKIYNNGAQYCFNNCTSLATVDFSSLSYVGAYALTGAFTSTAITSASFDSLTSIDNSYAFFSAFETCPNLTTLSFSGLKNINTGGDFCFDRLCYNSTAFASIDFSNLESIKANYVFNRAFYRCRPNFTTISFPKLSEISGSQTFIQAFQQAQYGGVGISSISFPALTPTSFGSHTDQFTQMLSGCSGVTVHFPASIQSTIGSWSDVVNGFGGTNTTVLFDL